MFQCRKHKICSILTCSSVFIFLIFYFQFNLLMDLTAMKYRDINVQDFVMIWWTPFLTGDKSLQCGEVSCLVSGNRKVWGDRSSAYLFYGSHFDKDDLPLPRANKVWGLLHEESPRNSPLLNHESLLNLFNFSSTFSRFSDFPLTFQYLPSLESITSINFFKTFEQKSNSSFSPVIYIQSDCVTPNNRDSYVFEMMKYIDVDSYGNCLNNKKLSDKLRNPVESMMSPDLLNLIGNYKFAISFENALCDDYITEKLWRPLIVGSIPVYMGSRSVQDWLPNNDSAILLQDFHSPKHLSDYLHYLSKNETAYNEHLKHKLYNRIDNAFLVNTYNSYREKVTGDNFIEEFECSLCRKLHQGVEGKLEKEQLNCYQPVSIVDNKYNSTNWWHNDYFVSKCQADLLRTFIDNDIPLNKMKFNC